MKKIFLFFIHLSIFASILQPHHIDPSVVFGEVYKIEQELNLIQEKLNIPHKKIDFPKDLLPIKPRHSWQKAYMVLVKINFLRKNLHFPRVSEIGVEPVLDLEPNLVYEMTQRVLTEVKIIKKLLHIQENNQKEITFKNKEPIDVYNYLEKISKQLDIINSQEITPSEVYSQVMRIYDDINIIITHLNFLESTKPPKKLSNATPKNAFDAAMDLLYKISEIQKNLGLPQSDFYLLSKTNIAPSDVFNLINMAIAELQTIKAALGITNIITPPANIYYGKQPRDVEQLIRWSVIKLDLINKEKK